MLNAQRKRELKKKYPNGKAVGKAFIQNYLERRKSDIQPDFQTTLTSEEISYLKSTVKTQRDSELYMPYYSLYKILRSFSRWIEHYQHVYYHGLYRGLAVIQTPDYDIQIYHYRKLYTPEDDEGIKQAETRYAKNLQSVTNILIPNWHEYMESSLKKLYSYSLRLEKMQELLKLDFSPLIPDMEYYVREVKELQRLAKCFRENLDKYINNDNFEVRSDVLEALDAFISIDTSTLKPTEEEREEDMKEAILAVKTVKEVIED